MNRPFMTADYYQNVANQLPGQAARADTVYAGGQYQDPAAPWANRAADIHQTHRTTRGGGSWGGYNVPSGYDPVGNIIQANQQGAELLQGDVDASQMLSLGRVSGSLSREARIRQASAQMRGPFGPIDPRGYGSTNGLGTQTWPVTGRIRTRLGAVAPGTPWYENPYYLGGGAAAIVAAVWFLTKKK